MAVRVLVGRSDDLEQALAERVGLAERLEHGTPGDREGMARELARPSPQAASRITDSNVSAARTTAGKRSSGFSGTRSESCDLLCS